MNENLNPLTNINEDEKNLRPLSFSEYVGQEELLNNLKIFVQAAKKRNESLDHILLYGPPGLGKTTLAGVLANELETTFKATSGPSIEKVGDIAAILSSLEPGDVLFIDEIHRLPKVVEEVLYSAMEDFYIDIVIGKEASVRSIRLDLAPFTLIGATTRVGDLTAPLRNRFGFVSKLEYYSESELESILHRTSQVFNTSIQEDAAMEIAKRSRGTPRITNRLFKRVRDFAEVLNEGVINNKITIEALDRLKVDAKGLDEVDIRYLHGIIDRFKGGPVGIEAIASSISEEVQTLEDVYEPYLLQIGFINRTSRGRIVTEKAYNHLKIDFQGKLLE